MFQDFIIHHDLLEMFWHRENADVDLLWEYLLHIILDSADVHCPIKRMRIRENSPHWMSQEIIEELHYKDFVYRKATFSGEPQDWVAFRSQNVNVKRLILKCQGRIYKRSTRAERE